MEAVALINHLSRCPDVRKILRMISTRPLLARATLFARAFLLYRVDSSPSASVLR